MLILSNLATSAQVVCLGVSTSCIGTFALARILLGGNASASSTLAA